MKAGSGAEQCTKLKANKIVAIIFENLLHSIALQQHPEPDQPEPRSTQTRSLLLYCNTSLPQKYGIIDYYQCFIPFYLNFLKSFKSLFTLLNSSGAKPSIDLT